MMRALAALSLMLAAVPATAQTIAANDGYRVCPAEKTREGVSVVQDACGALERPDFAGAAFSTLAELETARARRDAFRSDVDAYGQCVSDFITAHQRPGMPADSKAPDQAACAHSWAEDQATEAVREFGRACIDFSNRSMTDARITPWDGACYPVPARERG